MRDRDLFQLALGLASPWFVADCVFDGGKKRLDLRLDFKPGSRFACAPVNATGRISPTDPASDSFWFVSANSADSRIENPTTSHRIMPSTTTEKPAAEMRGQHERTRRPS